MADTLKFDVQKGVGARIVLSVTADRAAVPPATLLLTTKRIVPHPQWV
jgi:hypothetical protein